VSNDLVWFAMCIGVYAFCFAKEPPFLVPLFFPLRSSCAITGLWEAMHLTRTFQAWIIYGHTLGLKVSSFSQLTSELSVGLFIRWSGRNCVEAYTYNCEPWLTG